MPPFLTLHYEAVKVLDESIFIESLPLTVPIIYIPFIIPYIFPLFITTPLLKPSTLPFISIPFPSLSILPLSYIPLLRPYI